MCGWVSSCVGKRGRECVKEKKTHLEERMFTVDGELVECLDYKRFQKAIWQSFLSSYLIACDLSADGKRRNEEGRKEKIYWM